VTGEFDNRARLALYEGFVEEGEPPSAAELAERLDASAEETDAALQRLHDQGVIVLMPGTTEVWMAPPLSAVATGFRVETARGKFWGNCVWDGLGVVAMLDGDGTVETRCPDCTEPMTLRVENGQLVQGDGLAHFAVPAARWWDNIGFT
jgi:hypothetical protein